MKIAVDLDDTLSAVDRVSRAAAYIARKNLPFRPVDPDAHELLKVFDWQLDDVLRFIREGGVTTFTDAEARKGARETLERWRAAGHTVVILTARKKEWFQNPVSVSRDWLEKRKIPYDGLVAECADKGLYCAENGVSVLIDDSPEHCISAQERGVYAVFALSKGAAEYADRFDFVASNWRQIGQCVEKIVRTVQTQESVMRCYPAVKAERYDGWELRFDRRENRRLNCVRLIAPSVKPISEKIAFAEERYAAEGKPCRFLLTSLDGALDRELGARGYAVERPSEVWTSEELPDGAAADAIVAEETLSDEWRSAYEALRGEKLYGERYGNGIYVRLCIEGEPVAVACGVRSGFTLCVYHLFVRPDMRRRGYGRAVLERLLTQAKRKGALCACLQVDAENLNAKRLYRAVGFVKAYEYRYRLQTK